MMSWTLGEEEAEVKARKPVLNSVRQKEWLLEFRQKIKIFKFSRKATHLLHKLQTIGFDGMKIRVYTYSMFFNTLYYILA